MVDLFYGICCGKITQKMKERKKEKNDCTFAFALNLIFFSSLYRFCCLGIFAILNSNAK